WKRPKTYCWPTAFVFDPKNKLPDMLNILLNNLGELMLEQKTFTEASTVIREAMTLAREHENSDQLSMAGLLSLILEVEHGEISVILRLAELAESKASDPVRLRAYFGLYEHTGDEEYLNRAEIISDELYRQTRDIELKIKMEKLKARSR
ncbi:MAG: hypothetical protein QME74_10540, partial [Candidatus Edwardsbacteria bacterium]|nr:hypothetical protein [Candidatus Edwardsbacteria bacterium]